MPKGWLLKKLVKEPTANKVIKELSNKKFEYRAANFKKNYRFIFRINEKLQKVIITNQFHSKRNPNRLSAY